MSIAATPAPSSPPAGSQTLARGLRALEILGDAPRPLSITELADALGVHRSNAYRLLRTLEEHRFALRDDAGMIRLGPRMAALARGVAPGLTTAATPEITRLAQDTGMTAFLTVLDGDDIITIASAEPMGVPAAVSRRTGDRHSWRKGAPGHAIEASLSAAERATLLGEVTPTPESLAAIERGYALSTSEVMDGVFAVAVPLRVGREAPASIAVVHFNAPGSIESIVAHLQQTAERVARNYR
ncbi:DNA-binding IclR family transcriptional regulator [Leucobacter exalbidus]|uniref:DNA-binding IclR family transcriptional regulator n=1 Tax=Leucobacter exalbidus TaxID=662960 RepID=A0A940PXZ5_9MICO|nr:IclR family transcriptional regulator [Leucobacter exalbidus]MBP1327429.1 DNA-binding IclR family transcriptional regulator [Leucobacter exalbidus]